MKLTLTVSASTIAEIVDHMEVLAEKLYDGEGSDSGVFLDPDTARQVGTWEVEV